MNLQCSFINFLLKIKLDFGSNIMSIFVYKTATTNLIVGVKFFYIICKAILLLLFASKYCNKDLLRLILIYFEIVKLNNYNMHYLSFLFCLKKLLHLPTLHIKIKKNKDFCIKLLAFLEHIIKSFE